jgi:transcription elongation factor Elf1
MGKRNKKKRQKYNKPSNRLPKEMKFYCLRAQLYAASRCAAGGLGKVEIKRCCPQLSWRMIAKVSETDRLDLEEAGKMAAELVERLYQ